MKMNFSRKFYQFLNGKTISIATALTMVLISIKPLSNTYAYDYLIYGIDVSKYQGLIDWKAVKESGVDFAIIRAGTTAINGEVYSQDTYFSDNYTNAKNAGINVGAYYYCGAYTEEGFNQCTYDFLNSISGKEFDYPVYIDIEQASNQQELGKDVLTSYILSALDIIKDSGYTAGIYANKNWFANYINIEEIKENGYEIWLAQYPSGSYAVDPLNYDKSSECGIWQYSSLGSVSGISGYADLDVSYIKYAETKPAPEKTTEDTVIAEAVINTSSGVKVWSETGGTGKYICAAPNGTACKIEKIEGDWGYTGNIQGWQGDNLITTAGWIPLKYCTVEYKESIVTTSTSATTSAVTTITTTAVAEEILAEAVINTPSGVKVWSEAGGTGKYICAAPNGTACKIEKIEDDWGYTGNIQGWQGDDLITTAGWIPLKYCVVKYKESTVMTNTSSATSAVTTTTSSENTPLVVLPKELTIKIGEDYKLYVLNAEDKAEIEWFSSNNSIAKVKNGTVSGISGGKAVIYATFAGSYCEINVTVEEAVAGDLNSNNKFDIADAVMLQKYLLGAEKITESVFYVADLNNDNSVDVFDMILFRIKLIEQ